MDISLGDIPTCNPNSPNSIDCPTSCPNQGFEFVLQDNGNFGIPSVYANCNGTAAFNALAGGAGRDDQYSEHDRPGCSYPDWNVPPCGLGRTNEWMTFKIMLRVGSGGWNSWWSHVQVWFGREGQPLRSSSTVSQASRRSCTTRVPGSQRLVVFVNNAPATYKMGKVYLHPYRTCQNSGVCGGGYPGSSNAIAWYDELIISTQDIADPGRADTGCPSAPCCLTVSRSRQCPWWCWRDAPRSAAVAAPSAGTREAGTRLGGRSQNLRAMAYNSCERKKAGRFGADVEHMGSA